MKKNDNRHLKTPTSRGFTKLLRIMKLCTIIMFTMLTHAYSNGLGQRPITLNISNAELPRIFSAIEKKSGVSFLYNDDLLPSGKKFSVTANNQSVEKILDDLFKGSALSYRFFNNNLVVIGTSQYLSTQAEISGKVSAANGLPLAGVSVRVKGTTAGTSTDADGRYSISAPDGAVLVFSIIGFGTVEKTVSGSATIDVTLEPRTTQIEEVVVVGYGTQKRKNLTSSIASVSAAEIEKSTSVGIEQAIQGRAPGVQVISNSGQPGSGVQIRVRGTGSILGGNEPLYVIDGFPINNEQTGSDQGGQDRINGLAGVNPNDIASVEILKDAAAQAIYGSRGANGVVLITTKRGKTGKATISLNSFTGFQTFTNRYDLLNGIQFADLVKDAARRYPALNVDTTRLNTNINTNWQDEIFQTGLTQSTNISLQGGIDKTKYFVSASYYNQTGVVIGSGFNRATLRSNIDHVASKHVKFGINIYASAGVNNRIRNNGSPNFQDNFNGNNQFGPNVISSALVASPLYRPFNSDGSYGSDTSLIGTNNQNPVSLAKEADLSSNNFRGIANAYVEIDIIKGLKYRFNGGYDFRTEEENFYFPPIPNAFGSGRVTVGGYNERNYVLENYLTYTKQLNSKNNITVIAGQSYQYSQFQNSITGISGIGLPAIRILAAGNRDLFGRNTIEDYAFSSFYGRLNYEYADKYLLQFSARSDGSSRFGPNNKYGFFPAVSAAWRISNEAFMKDQDLFTDLRLRASFGRVGNAEVGNYDWRARLDPIRAYLGGTGVLVSNFANLDYSWENVEQLNIGFNASLLKDKINVSADYYERTTKDFLFNSRIPQTTGFGSARSSAGDLQNKGVELGLVTTNISKKDFTWTSSFNIGFNTIKLLRKNENIDDITAGPFGFAIRADVGRNIGYYMFELERFVDPQTGNIVVKDQNNSGSINDSDRVYQGSPFPKHTGGFNNDFVYKNFDLSVFFQWSYGNKIYNSTRAYIEEMGRGNNQSSVVLDRWKNVGDQTEVPVVSWNGSNSGFPSGRFLEDGSYLRLKNIQFGYRFAPNVLKRLKIESARLYFTAQNLLTFTNYRGFDPEVSGTTGRGTGTSIGVGEDFGTYPQAKTFVFGINLNL